MVVDSGNLNIALDEALHHGTDLGVRKYHVAHDHGAIVRWLECEPRAQRKRGFDRDAIQGDMEIRARQTVFVHASGQIRSRPTEGSIHLGPVEVGGRRAGARCHREHSGNPCHDAIHIESSMRAGIRVNSSTAETRRSSSRVSVYR